MSDPVAQTELLQALRDAVPAQASAAAAVIGVDGAPVAVAGIGEAVRYADADGHVAVVRPSADIDTVFDLASLTKVYTTVIALLLAQRGVLDLDGPIRDRLPEYVAGEVTLRQLLTHTAGLPAGVPLRGTEPSARRDLVLATEPVTRPGTVHCYSDVSLILAGWVIEAATGDTLDNLLRGLIADPLGLSHTGYGPAFTPDRCAATEYKDGVLRRGVVHDETAHLLGGVCGHAGIFATAGDVWEFAEALRDHRLLTAETTVDMTRRHARADRYGQGLGVRLDDPAITGALTGSFGHTGFTGTSFVVDQERAVSAVVLTNRVHPLRTQGNADPVRCAIADIAYRAQRRKHAGTS